MQQLPALAVFIALTALAALPGVTLRPGSWYAGLGKPAWTPPNWLFGPAWTLLYVLIAVAGWRVWRGGGLGGPAAAALVAWLCGLALNAAWSWIMFGRHQIGWALVDSALLLGTILVFIRLAWPVDRAAELLFVPYLAWVTFATALNAAVWRLNP